MSNALLKNEAIRIIYGDTKNKIKELMTNKNKEFNDLIQLMNDEKNKEWFDYPLSFITSGVRGMFNGIVDTTTAFAAIISGFMNNIGHMMDDTDKTTWEEDLRYLVGDLYGTVVEGFAGIGTGIVTTIGKPLGALIGQDWDLYEEAYGKGGFLEKVETHANNVRLDFLNSTVGDKKNLSYEESEKIVQERYKQGQSVYDHNSKFHNGNQAIFEALKTPNFGSQIQQAASDTMITWVDGSKWIKDNIIAKATFKDYYDERFADSDWYNYGMQTAESLGRMIPAIALTYLTGGSGAGASSFINASSLYFASSVFGSSFEEALNNGASYQDAYTFATGHMILESGTEMIGGFAFKEIPKINTFSDFFRMAIPEAAEEALSEVSNKGLERFSSASKEVTKETTKDFYQRIMLATITGGISGGIMGGGTTILSNATKQGRASSVQELIIDGVDKYGVQKTAELTKGNLNKLIKRLNFGNVDTKTKNDIVNQPILKSLITFDKDNQRYVFTSKGQRLSNGDVYAYQGTQRVSSSTHAMTKENYGKDIISSLDVDGKTIEIKAIERQELNKDTELAKGFEVLENIGANVVVVDGKNLPFNAFYDVQSGVTYINKNAKNGILNAFAHELHDKINIMATKGSLTKKGINAYKNFVNDLNSMSEESFSTLIKDLGIKFNEKFYRDLAAQKGFDKEVTDQMISRERISAFIEQAFNNKEIFNKAYKKYSLFEKLSMLFGVKENINYLIKDFGLEGYKKGWANGWINAFHESFKEVIAYNKEAIEYKDSLIGAFFSEDGFEVNRMFSFFDENLADSHFQTPQDLISSYESMATKEMLDVPNELKEKGYFLKFGNFYYKKSDFNFPQGMYVQKPSGLNTRDGGQIMIHFYNQYKTGAVVEHETLTRVIEPDLVKEDGTIIEKPRMLVFATKKPLVDRIFDVGKIDSQSVAASSAALKGFIVDGFAGEFSEKNPISVAFVLKPQLLNKPQVFLGPMDIYSPWKYYEQDGSLTLDFSFKQITGLKPGDDAGIFYQNMKFMKDYFVDRYSDQSFGDVYIGYDEDSEFVIPGDIFKVIRSGMQDVKNAPLSLEKVKSMMTYRYKHTNENALDLFVRAKKSLTNLFNSIEDEFSDDKGTKRLKKIISSLNAYEQNTIGNKMFDANKDLYMDQMRKGFRDFKAILDFMKHVEYETGVSEVKSAVTLQDISHVFIRTFNEETKNLQEYKDLVSKIEKTGIPYLSNKRFENMKMSLVEKGTKGNHEDFMFSWGEQYAHKAVVKMAQKTIEREAGEDVEIINPKSSLGKMGYIFRYEDKYLFHKDMFDFGRAQVGEIHFDPKNRVFSVEFAVYNEQVDQYEQTDTIHVYPDAIVGGRIIKRPVMLVSGIGGLAFDKFLREGFVIGQSMALTAYSSRSSIENYAMDSRYVDSETGTEFIVIMYGKPDALERENTSVFKENNATGYRDYASFFRYKNSFDGYMVDAPDGQTHTIDFSKKSAPRDSYLAHRDVSSFSYSRNLYRLFRQQDAGAILKNLNLMMDGLVERSNKVSDIKDEINNFDSDKYTEAYQIVVPYLQEFLKVEYNLNGTWEGNLTDFAERVQTLVKTLLIEDFKNSAYNVIPNVEKKAKAIVEFAKMKQFDLVRWGEVKTNLSASDVGLIQIKQVKLGNRGESLQSSKTYQDIVHKIVSLELPYVTIAGVNALKSSKIDFVDYVEKTQNESNLVFSANDFDPSNNENGNETIENENEKAEVEATTTKNMQTSFIATSKATILPRAHVIANNVSKDNYVKNEALFKDSIDDILKTLKKSKKPIDKRMMEHYENWKNYIYKLKMGRNLYNHMGSSVSKTMFLELHNLFEKIANDNREKKAATPEEIEAIIQSINTTIFSTLNFVDTDLTVPLNVTEKNPNGYLFTKAVYWYLRDIKDITDWSSKEAMDLVKDGRGESYRRLINAIININKKGGLDELRQAVNRFNIATNVETVVNLALEPASTNTAGTTQTVMKQWKRDVENAEDVQNIIGFNMFGNNGFSRKLSSGIYGMLDGFTVSEVAGMFNPKSWSMTLMTRILEGADRQLRIKRVFDTHFEEHNWLKRNYKNVVKLEKNVVQIKNLGGAKANMSQVIYLRDMMLREVARNRAIDMGLMEGTKTTHFDNGNEIRILKVTDNSAEKISLGKFAKITNTLALLNELDSIIQSDSFAAEYNTKILEYFTMMYPYINERFKEINGINLRADGFEIKEKIKTLDDTKKAEFFKDLPNTVNDFNITDIYIPFLGDSSSYFKQDSLDFKSIIDMGVFDGMTKELQDTNSIIQVESITHVTSAYAKQVENYYGLHRIMEDLNIVLNENIEGYVQPTNVKKYIHPKLLKFYQELLKDMAGYKTPSKNPEFQKMLSWVRKNFYRASLAANVKVVLTQFNTMFNLSYLYGEGIGFLPNFYKNLYAQFTPSKKAKVNSMLKDNNFYWDRSGHSIYDIGEATSEGIGGANTFERVLELTMKGIVLTDNAINKAFYLTLLETKNPNTGAKFTEQEASETLKTAILRSQSSALDISKASLLRSDNEIVRIFMKFMGEPLKLFSQIYGASKKLELTRKLEENKAAIDSHFEQKVEAEKQKLEDLKREADQNDIIENSPEFTGLPDDEQKKIHKKGLEIKKKIKAQSKVYVEEVANKDKVLKHVEDVIDEKPMSRKKLRLTLTAYLSTVSYMTFVSMLFAAVRTGGGDKEKDKDETNWQWFKDRTLSAFIDEQFSMYPFIRDIYNALAHGFEFTSIDEIGSFQDLADTYYYLFQNMINGKIDDTNWGKTIRSTVVSIGKIFGIPTTNLERIFTTSTLYFAEDLNYRYNNLIGKANRDNIELAQAIKEDNDKMINAIIENKLNKREILVSNKVFDELTRLAKTGNEVSITGINDSFTHDGIEYKMTRSQKQKFASIYNQADLLIAKFIVSASYKRLTDNKKKTIIQAIYNYYYRKAKQEISGVDIIPAKNDFKTLAHAYAYFVKESESLFKQKKP